MGKSLPSTFLI